MSRSDLLLLPLVLQGGPAALRASAVPYGRASGTLTPGFVVPAIRIDADDRPVPRTIVDTALTLLYRR